MPETKVVAVGQKTSHRLSYVIIPDKLSPLLKFFRPEIPLVQVFPYPDAPLCKGFNQIKSLLGKFDILNKKICNYLNFINFIFCKNNFKSKPIINQVIGVLYERRNSKSNQEISQKMENAVSNASVFLCYFWSDFYHFSFNCH